MSVTPTGRLQAIGKFIKKGASIFGKFLKKNVGNIAAIGTNAALDYYNK
jgi:hypothetical protein